MPGSVSRVTFGAITAAIIAVFTLASGAIILIPTWLWSLGLISGIDTLMYKLVWWGMGHSSQQINVAAHITIWCAIAAMVVGAKPLSEKVSRFAFLMYIFFLQLASAHHLLAEPGMSGVHGDDLHRRAVDIPARHHLADAGEMAALSVRPQRRGDFAAAAAPQFGPAIGLVPILLAAVLFLWTPPHFWSLAAVRVEDYRRAKVPMLPVVAEPEVWGAVIFIHVLSLVVLSFVPLWFGMGWIYGFFAARGRVPFVLAAWRLLRDPTRATPCIRFRSRSPSLPSCRRA